MSLNKGVTILADDLLFIVDPSSQCLSGHYGLTSVEGLSANNEERK